VVLKPLRQETEFRPQAADIEDFLNTDPAPRGIFLEFAAQSYRGHYDGAGSAGYCRSGAWQERGGIQ
jgi:hypothetical protein